MTSTPRTSRTIATLVAVVLVVAGVRLVQGADGGSTSPDRGSDPAVPDTATAQARAFLDAYVEPTGRVVRRDQGGDTVSEGQAWALLLAVALGDEPRAATIVDWTQAHIARPDGGLAWRWVDGEVADPQPASDADLVYGWALARGAEAFGRPTWRVRAGEVAQALARTSVTPTPGGPVIAAGPWATQGDAGAIVNPSYLWPSALRWAATAAPSLADAPAASRALLERLVGDDTPLVPDWVRVAPDGAPTAIGTPDDPDAPPRHGLDAVRTWIWLAADCDPQVRSLAATASGRFPDDPHDLKAVHDLKGMATVDWRHPATLAGAAAVADAAGDTELARARLEGAARLQADHPTYYGGAVTALARLLLQTDRLASCDVSG